MSNNQESYYNKLRNKFSFHLKGSGSSLFKENDVAKAEDEILKSLKFLNDIKMYFPASVSGDQFKEDFNEAFTMYFKVLESKEDEAQLVSFALELSEHEDLQEDLCEVVKGLISKILTRPGQVAGQSQSERILGLVCMVRSSHSRALLLIELNNQAVFHSLPDLPAREAMSVTEVTEVVGLMRQSRGKAEILSWLLRTPWTSAPLDTEHLLTKCLLICSESEELLEIAMEVLTKYINLLVSPENVDCHWRCGEVVLGLGDRVKLQVSHTTNTHVTERWLAGLFLVSLVIKNTSAHILLTEQLLQMLIHQGKLSHLKLHLTSLKDSKSQHSPLVLKAIFLSELSSRHFQGAANILVEIARDEENHWKTGGERREWLCSLIVYITDEKCLLGRESLAHLVSCLAGRTFHLSLPVLEFCLVLAVRLGQGSLAHLAALILTDCKNTGDWLKGAESCTAGLCWSLGLSSLSSSPLTSLTLWRMVGAMSPLSDPRKVSNTSHCNDDRKL